MSTRLIRDFLGKPMFEKSLREIPCFESKYILISEKKGFEYVIQYLLEIEEFISIKRIVVWTIPCNV